MNKLPDETLNIIAGFTAKGPTLRDRLEIIQNSLSESTKQEYNFVVKTIFEAIEIYADRYKNDTQCFIRIADKKFYRYICKKLKENDIEVVIVSYYDYSSTWDNHNIYSIIVHNIMYENPIIQKKYFPVDNLLEGPFINSNDTLMLLKWD